MKRTAWFALIMVLSCAAILRAQAPKATGLQKQFLYRVRVVRAEMMKNPTQEESAVAQEHFNYLKDLNSKGIIILAGRTLNTDETPFGIVIFHAESEAAAKKIMEGDPGVRKGIFHADLFPFRVALMESTQGN
jgi:uncharacterized protein YciI